MNGVEGVAFRVLFASSFSLVTVYVLLKSISDAVSRPLQEEELVRPLRAAKKVSFRLSASLKDPQPSCYRRAVIFPTSKRINILLCGDKSCVRHVDGVKTK